MEYYFVVINFGNHLWFLKKMRLSLHFFCGDAWGMGSGHVRGVEWGSRSCISIEIFGALERLICIEWGAVERGETRCVCENILSLFTALHVPYLFAPMVGFDFDAVCCRNQGLLHGEKSTKAFLMGQMG